MLPYSGRRKIFQWLISYHIAVAVQAWSYFGK